MVINRKFTSKMDHIYDDSCLVMERIFRSPILRHIQIKMYRKGYCESLGSCTLLRLGGERTGCAKRLAECALETKQTRSREDYKDYR